jgi:hypothetical protein
MNLKEKQKFKKDKQLFNENNRHFLLVLAKVNGKEITVAEALKQLGISSTKYYELKKEYYRLTGKNY